VDQIAWDIDSLSVRLETRYMNIAMLAFVGMIGLFIGSFLNVLIDRLPKGQNVLWGRSHCDFCKRNLRWYELIPLVSFVIQMGRCRRCHKKLSIQYPVIELITAMGFVVIYSIYFASPIPFVSYCVVFSAFLVMFMADCKYQILPDSMIICGIAGTLPVLFFTAFRYDVLIHGISGAGAFIFFLLLYLRTIVRFSVHCFCLICSFLDWGFCGCHTDFRTQKVYEK
jgi:leader peptidase (prepilin peptidase)/N-methyltransferase